MGESSGAEGRRNKRLKLEIEEDRISALPDCVIHHILSFLRSTEQAIQTGILSKRWKHQWTRVPILIFDSGRYPTFSWEDFARFIDSVLLQYDCLEIKKLHLSYDFGKDVNFSSKIYFATRKHVEELILCCFSSEPDDPYPLPEFLFNNVSLVKLELRYCSINCDWSINWGSLRAFTMSGFITEKLVANVLSGSPSLEILELECFGGGDGGGEFVIASNSLKTLILTRVDIYSENQIRISCPNLEELFFDGWDEFPHKMIANIASHCPLLRVLELKQCCFDQLVISSKSLKKLALRENTVNGAIEISCPNLEEFNFCGETNKMFRLLSIPRVTSATLDVEIPWSWSLVTTDGSEDGEDVSKQILDQLQNVEELTFGSTFIKILSDLEMRGLYYSCYNNKFLTLDSPNFEHFTGIICALRSSPMLARLVIKLRVYKIRTTADLLDLNDPQANCWNSNRIVSNTLMSHLRTVKIIGISKRDAKCKIVVDFIEVLLNNARALEKLVIMISEDEGESFALAVLQKVSSFPRCSPHAIVELLRPQWLEL